MPSGVIMIFLRKFRLHHAEPAPMDVNALVQQLQPGLFSVQSGQRFDFFVDMHIDVVARIVNAVEPGLQQAELIMGQYQISVLHTIRCLRFRSLSISRPAGVL